MTLFVRALTSHAGNLIVPPKERKQGVNYKVKQGSLEKNAFARLFAGSDVGIVGMA